MKRILHMTPPEIKNGVYRYIFNHMGYINQEEYQFAFLTKVAEELKQTKEYGAYRFPVHSLKHTERENKSALEREIRSILKEGYDVIHLHTSSWRGFFIEEIAMDMGIKKVIVHSHSTGIDVADNLERTERLAEHDKYKERFTLRYATDVCACSRPAGDWLFGAQIPREKIHILPNAIDVERYRFRPEIRLKKRRELGLDDRIIIGNVGRYCYQKNQEFLIRTFSAARQQNAKLFLILMGEGKAELQLKELAKELHMEAEVLFMGWQEDVEEYLQAMDVFCLPSRFEGLPISAIEAQAAGLKCLISDAVSEEILLTDQAMLLPLEEGIWQKALTDIEANDARELYGRKLQEQGYDLRTAAGKLTELYDGN